MTKKELKNKLIGAKYFHQIIIEKTIAVENFKKFVEKLKISANEMDVMQKNPESMHQQTIKDTLENEERSLCEFMLNKKAIESMINLLPQPYNLVLYLRYISCESFKQIGKKMNYSEKRIYQLHDIALNLLLEKQLEDETLETIR